MYNLRGNLRESIDNKWDEGDKMVVDKWTTQPVEVSK